MHVLKKIFSNKRIVVAVIVLIAACIGVAGVAAYLSVREQTDNVISIGENKIQLVEDFTPPKELTPGVSFTKDVSVQNTGDVDCYVRMKAVFSDSDMGDYCTVDWNTTDWVYNEQDEYYYCPILIKPGESTPSLFTTVTLSEEIDPAIIKDFDIIVYAESYQAYGYDDYTDAWANYKANRPS